MSATGHAASSIRAGTSAARVTPLDPSSQQGRDAAAALGRLHAAVIERLRSEGKPLPPEAPDPSP